MVKLINKLVKAIKGKPKNRKATPIKKPVSSSKNVKKTVSKNKENKKKVVKKTSIKNTKVKKAKMIKKDNKMKITKKKETKSTKKITIKKTKPIKEKISVSKTKTKKKEVKPTIKKAEKTIAKKTEVVKKTNTKKAKVEKVPEVEEKKKRPKFSVKLLEEVVGELFGEEVIPLIFRLKDGENISEFILANDLKWDIHQTRAILYKLYEYGLASFFRKKDKVKGWYVCYWDLDVTKLDHINAKLQQEKIDKLKVRLQKEEANNFYMCKHLCVRTTFDKAMDLEFKCPECNEIMNPIDNKRTIEFLNERLAELKKEASA